MDFWLILDGEKTGPFPDYEIRSRIARGELAADTPAWHQGLDRWRPLGEIALFAGDFGRVDTTTATPPPLPPPPQAPLSWRRFWARWLDIHLYLAAWWLCLWALGQPVAPALESMWVMLLQLVPWFIVEAVLLHRWGSTPGKWLMGLRVANDDGTRLTLRAALARSLRVLFAGIGFGWLPLALLCQWFAFSTARRLGKPLWDYQGGHVVRAAALQPWRAVTLGLGLFVALQLQMAVIGPAVTKAAIASFPQLKEALEKNPPWHLPERE